MASFGHISAFIQAYKETALWSSLDDTNTPLDDDKFSDYGWSLDAITRITKDCDKFIAEAEEAGILTLDSASFAEQAGHDFWLTRNRHGAGFWDDPGLYGTSQSKALTELAHKFGECDIQPDSSTEKFEVW